MPKGKKILPNATRESPIINVDRPMVKNKLHWEELRIPRNLSGSIWDTSTSALPREKNIFEIINRHHFEELFCVEKATLASSLSVVSMNSSEDLVSPEKSKNKGKSSGFRKQTPAKIYVLGLRRVNNVGISLARFYKRLSDDEIIDSIVLRRVNLMSLDDLLALKSAIPTAEERSSLLAFQGSKDSLGAVESFLLQAAREPDLDWMLEALIFERQFDSDVEVLAGKLTRIIDALNLIRNSESLQILLHAVLQLGNLVNYEYGRAGTSRAQASAFRLESLLRLQEVKSADNKTTLLTYLVTCLEDRHPDLLSLPVDFSTLSVVRNWDSQALLLQVGEIATQFLRIRDPKIKQKHGANETSSTSAGRLSDFTEAQRTFLDRAAASLERLGSLAEEMRTALSKTLQYFGEPPKELTLKNGASLSAHTESGDTRLAESMFTVLDEFFKALSETTTSIRKTRTIKSKVLSGSLSNSSSKESVSNIPSDESSQQSFEVELSRTPSPTVSLKESVTSDNKLG